MHVELTTALVFLLAAMQAGSPDTGGEGAVRGRIEITNPKVKLRGGEADAGGVAVWLIPAGRGPVSATHAPARGKIIQRDKRFIPHVLVVQTGTEIDFPNQDPFFHNVFSTFEGKRFDLGLYAKGESRPVRFNRAGISYIYCNIHPHMSAVIVTVDTPFFAASAQDGIFQIGKVPLGEYHLRVWHERSEPQQLEAQRRIVSVRAPLIDIGVIRLDEAAYLPTAHKNKHGEDYPAGREPVYGRP